MYSKIIIAEDLASINEGIVQLSKKLGIPNITPVQYCDEAYLKIKKAIKDKQPYELLITDLSFKVTHREENYTKGEELIEALKNEHPQLKIIVFSIEDRPTKIKNLMNKGIEAYVCKDRTGLKELEEAIQQTWEGGTYLSPQIASALENKQLEVDDFDVKLLQHLADGCSQDEISQLFKSKHISPSSLSSIEKRVSRLKIQLDAKNTYQLIALAKDIGLI